MQGELKAHHHYHHQHHHHHHPHHHRHHPHQRHQHHHYYHRRRYRHHPHHQQLINLQVTYFPSDQQVTLRHPKTSAVVSHNSTKTINNTFTACGLRSDHQYRGTVDIVGQSPGATAQAQGMVHTLHRFPITPEYLK